MDPAGMPRKEGRGWAESVYQGLDIVVEYHLFQGCAAMRSVYRLLASPTLRHLWRDEISARLRSPLAELSQKCQGDKWATVGRR